MRRILVLVDSIRALESRWTSVASMALRCALIVLAASTKGASRRAQGGTLRPVEESREPFLRPALPPGDRCQDQPPPLQGVPAERAAPPRVPAANPQGPGPPRLMAGLGVTQPADPAAAPVVCIGASRHDDGRLDDLALVGCHPLLVEAK